MQGTKSYRFLSAPSRTTQSHDRAAFEFEGEYSFRYFQELDGLASDIAGLLKAWRNRRPPRTRGVEPDPPAVYLAETTSDLDGKLSELRRDLKDRGYVVLPDVI